MVLKFILDFFYALAVLAFSPVFLKWFLSDRRRAAGFSERLGNLRVPSKSGKRIWFLGSSLGEINACRRLIHTLRQGSSGLEAVVTATTLAGREQAIKLFPDCTVGYNPLDFSWCVERALRTVRPDSIVLIELELWPNFVLAAERQNIPVCVVNGRMTERTAGRYQCLKPLFHRLFRSLSGICVQNEVYADRFRAVGAPSDRIVVTGNIKYDLPPAVSGPRGTSLDWITVPEGAFVLVAGSTHDPEEAALADVFRRLQSEGRPCHLILAPRHPDRIPAVEEIVHKAGGAVRRRTQCDARHPWSPSSREVLILDTVGELARVYGAGSAAYIGGTMGSRGGQNPVEAAQWGKPLLAGENFSNFRDVADVLKDCGALQTVETREELYHAIVFIMEHPEEARRRGAHGRDVVARWSGALDRTVHAIRRHL